MSSVTQKIQEGFLADVHASEQQFFDVFRDFAWCKVVPYSWESSATRRCNVTTVQYVAGALVTCGSEEGIETQQFVTLPVLALQVGCRRHRAYHASCFSQIAYSS